ncbi:HD domain-containing protein [Methylobacterium sp. E-041]|uniref:HD domain-containing protein n=1 Tax=Methylobacterium sp. E-041 TaxID=2836573 RepID=UPI001FBB0CC1|nr:HD domain-containing protein [Methylobacterium sp. E-041]MCJ2104712.1 HD domain-containing protein [Methylobacterium sp. E-041]
MRTSVDAELLARARHAGQVDKAGQPYVEHLRRVADAAEQRAVMAAVARLPIDVDSVVQAAWLHDVIEDTATTATDLLHAGYAPRVVAMVELLTKPENRVTYDERVAKIIDSGNLGAILIKLSDNEDNASPSRPLPGGSEKLALRYGASMARLRVAAEALGYPQRPMAP